MPTARRRTCCATAASFKASTVFYKRRLHQPLPSYALPSLLQPGTRPALAKRGLRSASPRPMCPNPRSRPAACRERFPHAAPTRGRRRRCKSRPWRAASRHGQCVEGCYSPICASMGGHLSFHGAAASYAAAARSTVTSSRCRPTICSPIGRPSLVNPAGTVAAGCPVMLN
jgi:hypothetical protein